MTAKFYLKIIAIFMLGCFVLQNARANLLFMQEWNFDGSRKFYGNVKKIEEYFQNKLMLTFLFDNDGKLRETLFVRDKTPYSFRYYYNEINGKMERIELFNRSTEKIESEEQALFNEAGDVVAFHSFANGKLIQKSSAVISDDKHRISMIVLQDSDSKVSEIFFEYYPDDRVKQIRYSHDGKILNTAIYSYPESNKVIQKRFDEQFQLKETFYLSYTVDAENNWVKEVRQIDSFVYELIRKIEYGKKKTKWFFGIF